MIARFATTALALLAPLCPPAAPRAADDAVATWLDRLASGSATERDRAQRWLGANLELEDYPELAAGARAADAETGRRLVEVLGADGANLGLVALLLTDRERRLREIGEGAFDELVARWCPGAAGRSVTLSAIRRGLVDRASRLDVSTTGASEPLGVALDRLARFGELGVPLVVDPAIEARLLGFGTFEGKALDLLDELAKAQRLAITGIGEWEGGHPGAGAWILVGSGGGSFSRSGVERLRSWVEGVERGSREAPGAARALGACGWPAAVEWLDRRWSERGDERALEGLLIAAARGRVARSLLRPSTRVALLALADRDLAGGTLEGWLRAERIARALGAAGSMTLGGEDGGEAVLEGWAELSLASRWLRLVVVEGQRSSRAPVRERLLEIVEREAGLEPALRFQALRALASLGRRPLRSVEPADLASLVEWARGQGRGEEAVALLGSLGVQPPEGAAAPPPLVLAAWRLELGDAEGFVRLLSTRGVLPEPLADVRVPAADSWSEHFRRWSRERGPARLRSLVDDALSRCRGADRERLATLALLGGCLGDEEQRVIWRILAERRPLGALDLQKLGALAAGPDRREVIEALLGQLEAPPAEPERQGALVDALDRALAALFAARRDPAAESLREGVQQRILAADHPLYEALNPIRWPRLVPAVVVELERSDRELPAELRGR